MTPGRLAEVKIALTDDLEPLGWIPFDLKARPYIYAVRMWYPKAPVGGEEGGVVYEKVDGASHANRCGLDVAMEKTRDQE
jgi:hypothetical protein